MSDRTDPFVSYAFRVEIDGIELFGFKEISGIGTNTDIYEYQEGGENYYTHKLVGQTTHSNIVLKYGITTDSSILEWRKEVLEGNIDEAKRNGTIKLFNKKGEYSKSWNFYNAWPCKIEVGNLNSTSNEIAISMIELAVERTEES
jgi:phage tail-like protein